MKKFGIFLIVITMTFFSGCGANTSNAAQAHSKDKYVENEEYTTVFFNGEYGIEFEGLYTGNLVDGCAEGVGFFSANVDDETVLEYTGNFEDGYFDGYGELSFIDNTSEELLCMNGTFDDGEFTPTISELFDYAQQFTGYAQYTLTSDISDYLDSHSELFPVANSDTINNLSVDKFSYKKFIKTRKQETVGLEKINLLVLQIFEDDILYGTLTSLLATDDNGNYYNVYYLGSVDIYEDDKVTVYAIPCEMSEFDNVSGGTTKVVVMLSPYIK